MPAKRGPTTNLSYDVAANLPLPQSLTAADRGYELNIDFDSALLTPQEIQSLAATLPKFDRSLGAFSSVRRLRN